MRVYWLCGIKPIGGRNATEYYSSASALAKGVAAYRRAGWFLTWGAY